MALDKYKLIKGKFVNISPFIYQAIELDTIDYDIVITESSKRLDHYSKDYYDDANNWWIIAAASGIGWWLQVPEGVVLRIPTDISQVIKLKDEIE